MSFLDGEFCADNLSRPLSASTLGLHTRTKTSLEAMPNSSIRIDGLKIQR